MDATLDFATLDRLSRDFAAWLVGGAGLAKGDRVAVMMPNVLQYPVALFGILRAGMVVVNCNPLYTPRELEHQLNDAGVETIVIYAGATPTLAEIVARTRVKTVITVAPADGTKATGAAPPVDARLSNAIACASTSPDARVAETA